MRDKFDRDYVEFLYNVKCMNKTEIGRKMGVHVNTMRAFMNKNNIIKKRVEGKDFNFFVGKINNKRAELGRCWACGCKAISKKGNSRLETHHVFGNGSHLKVNLCVLCHDLVDRVTLDNLDVFSYFMEMLNDVEKLSKKESKVIKLMLLKLGKIMEFCESNKKNLPFSKHQGL